MGVVIRVKSSRIVVMMNVFLLVSTVLSAIRYA